MKNHHIDDVRTQWLYLLPLDIENFSTKFYKCITNNNWLRVHERLPYLLWLAHTAYFSPTISQKYKQVHLISFAPPKNVNYTVSRVSMFDHDTNQNRAVPRSIINSASTTGLFDTVVICGSIAARRRYGIVPGRKGKLGKRAEVRYTRQRTRFYPPLLRRSIIPRTERRVNRISNFSILLSYEAGR